MSVENLSLFALIYLRPLVLPRGKRWESFIIRLDILNYSKTCRAVQLRIFHYSPWYTYFQATMHQLCVENLSLFALIYLHTLPRLPSSCWESFIIRLDILNGGSQSALRWLRIFHYSPWYTYEDRARAVDAVENLSLFALIYLRGADKSGNVCWESFIIRLDILINHEYKPNDELRIFHYSPWYT